MVQNGQIDEKESKFIREEIDNKIHFLSLNAPEIQLIDHIQTLVNYSELSEIFGNEKVKLALLGLKIEEKIFRPGDLIEAKN